MAIPDNTRTLIRLMRNPQLFQEIVESLLQEEYGTNFRATDIYELAQTLESIDPTRALNLYREVLGLYKKLQSAELLKEVGERIRQLKRK